MRNLLLIGITCIPDDWMPSTGGSPVQRMNLNLPLLIRNTVEAAEMAVSEQEEVDQMCSFGEQSVPIARHFFIVQLSGSGRERVIIAAVQSLIFA